MNFYDWQIVSQSSTPLFSENWRERLIDLLGYRPRRQSLFTESILYGAFDCLANMDEPQRTLKIKNLSTIRVSTVNGTHTATQKVINESRHELPMPFTFLQSQLSQALTTLAANLNWEGDASIIISKNHDDFTRLAMLSVNYNLTNQGDLLLGWAEELHEDRDNSETKWIWLSKNKSIID